MEEALQSGKSEIAEYLAPRTKLEDDKIYSVIPEAQIYDENEEEEKKDIPAQDRSFQSEEARQPEDYQPKTSQEKQMLMEERDRLNKEAADEARLGEISQELKEKLNMHEFDVKVVKTAEGESADGAQKAASQ